MRHFIVSPRRMLLTSGVIVRTVTLLPRRRITDLTWQETLFGQLLGYGTFRIESAGQAQALSRVTYLPRVDVLYRKISELLFPGDSGGDGDETGDEEPPRRPPPRQPPPPPGTGRRDTVAVLRRGTPGGLTPRVPEIAMGQGGPRCGSTCTPTPRCPTAPRPRRP